MNILINLKGRDYVAKLPKWGGVEIAEETLVRWVRESIEYLEEFPNEPYGSTMSGDSFVMVMREDSETSPYEVMICKVMRRGLVSSEFQGVE